MSVQPDAPVLAGYLALIQRFPLRKIRSAEQFDAALQVLEGLIDRQDTLDAGEKDYLEMLSDLVDRYEASKHLIPPPADADLLRQLMEARALSVSEVARGTGISEETLGAVLAGKLVFDRCQIGRVSRFFRVSPGEFSFGE